MRKLQKSGLTAAVLMALVSSVPSPPARSASDASNGPVLEEIVVTATKHAELLQDVPLSVSVISAQDIQARGFNQFADYLNTIPGVYFEDGGPGDSIIHIRGLTESGVGSTVASYFGEALTSVLTNHGGKPNLRLVDIDRIEVLRGPQGTIFGADALAGVLRIIPMAPDATRFETDADARGFTTAHSGQGSYHVEGVVNFPLIQDRLALRIVAYKDDIAGYIDNIVPAQPPVDYGGVLGLPPGLAVTPAIAAFTQKDINREDVWGARASVRWQPIDHLNFDFTYLRQDDTLMSEPFTAPAAGPYAQNRALDAFEPGGEGERIDIKTLTASYDWNAVSLIAISNWMQMNRFTDQDITFLADLSFSAPIPWGLHDTSVGHVFTEEVRLESRGDQAFQWTLGGFFLHQYADLSQFVPDYSCPTCLPEILFNQNFAFDVPLQKFSDQKQRSVFADLSYEFLKQWTVGAGGRYLQEDIESLNPSSDGLLAGGNLPGGAPITGSIHEFSPSAYVRYKPIKDVTLYAQYSRGFRSGDVNEPYPTQCQADAAAAGLKAITQPDTLRSYELGVKSSLDEGRLVVNADVYKDRWSGVQLDVALQCGFSGIVNSGDINGKGVELELIAQPSSAWRFNFSFAYNQNKFDDVEPGTGFLPGERLPDSPEKNGSVGAEYRLGLMAGWTGLARVDVLYVGDVQLRYGPTLVSESAYAAGNVRLGVEHNTLGIELFGNNVTDKRGVSFTDNPAFGGHQTLIRPREVGVEVRYAFR